MKARSTSSLEQAGPRQKWREALALLSMRRHAASRRQYIEGVLTRIDSMRSTYERLTGRSFAEARVFEIGYGAQPFRIIALMSMGIRAKGIDLDMPMLRFSLPDLMEIRARNGFERALKTGFRSLLFDRRDYAHLKSALEKRGYAIRINPADLLVGDAATFDFGPEPYDLVYSQDAFEHIPREGIQKIMARLATRLAPNGLALITPNIFTGITGGHLPEWYWDSEDNQSPRRSEPWEHLRKKRFQANTWLNRLARRDYRELFSHHFEIVEETVQEPNLGCHRLTPEIRAELAQWDDEELFSNTVQFALRPRSAPPVRPPNS
jgi:hypothetical protein